MGFIKLTEPSQAHTLLVKSVKLNSSGNWPDFEFSDGTDTVQVPVKATERQFTRLSVQNADQLVGSWVKFSRSDKPGSNGKLFWNLDLAHPVERAQPSGKRLTHAEASGPSMGHVPGLDDFPPPSDDDNPYNDPPRAPTPHRVPTIPESAIPLTAERAKVARAYLDLLAWVKSQPEVKGDPAEAVQATAATIFIEWNKRGLVK